MISLNNFFSKQEQHWGPYLVVALGLCGVGVVINNVHTLR